MLKQRYRLLAQQGAGGMAVVYRANDEALGRTVALKIMRPNLSKDANARQRFLTEAQHIARLQHPNIVTLYDLLSEDDHFVLVMEFIEGRDLKRELRDRGTLPVQRAVDIAAQLGAGLGYAHRHGIVHADVKSQNVLLTADGRVKITDFGIAKAFRRAAPAAKSATVWGSPHYFAPEQALGAAPTPESDIYSLGIVLFEMLTGRLPYRGDDQKELALAHLREDIPLVSAYNPNVPPPLVNIVRKLMSKDAAARYRSGEQVAHVMRAYREYGAQATIEGSSLVAAMAAPKAIKKASRATHRPYTSLPPRRERRERRRAHQGGSDYLTLFLALLAILAVAGLLPLYASLLPG